MSAWCIKVTLISGLNLEEQAWLPSLVDSLMPISLRSPYSSWYYPVLAERSYRSGYETHKPGPPNNAISESSDHRSWPPDQSQEYRGLPNVSRLCPIRGGTEPLVF